MIRKIFIIISTLFLVMAICGFAQTAEYRYVHQGNKAFEQKDYKTAESYYLKALKANPQSPQVHFNLGDTYLAQKNVDEALKQFAITAKTLNDKELKGAAYYNMGNIYHRQKEYDKAIDYYKEALRNNPHDENARYNLILAKRQQQQNKNDKQQQQQQQKQEDNQKENNQNQQQSQQQQQSSMSDESVEQLLNLSRQSEEQTRKKVDESQQPRQRRLEKNW